MLDSLPPKIRDKGVKSKKYKQVFFLHRYDFVSLFLSPLVIGGASFPGLGAENFQQELQQLSHGRDPSHNGQERTR